MKPALLPLMLPAALIACGGEAPQSEPKIVADSAAAIPAVAPASDSASRAAPGPTRTPASPKAEQPLRDSAFGPRYAVDSTGKVVPLTKRP